MSESSRDLDACQRHPRLRFPATIRQCQLARFPSTTRRHVRDVLGHGVRHVLGPERKECPRTYRTVPTFSRGSGAPVRTNARMRKGVRAGGLSPFGRVTSGRAPQTTSATITAWALRL